MERIQARDTNFLFGRCDVLRLHSVGLGYLSSNTQQKTQLNHKPNCTLIVLMHVRTSLMPLRLGHLNITVDEYSVPWDLHFIEINHRIVLVK